MQTVKIEALFFNNATGGEGLFVRGKREKQKKMQSLPVDAFWSDVQKEKSLDWSCQPATD